MKISFKTNEIDNNITIPNALIMNDITSYLIAKNIKIDIDKELLDIIFKSLKVYIKTHPNFELVEVISEDQIIKISL